jgi:hypothetical protein
MTKAETLASGLIIGFKREERREKREERREKRQRREKREERREKREDRRNLTTYFLNQDSGF